MKLGTQNFQVLAVESWQGSGSAQLTLSKGAASGGSTGGSTTTTTKASAPTSTVGSSAPTSTGSTGGNGGSSGATSPKYGQCGGMNASLILLFMSDLF